MPQVGSRLRLACVPISHPLVMPTASPEGGKWEHANTHPTSQQSPAVRGPLSLLVGTAQAGTVTQHEREVPARVAHRPDRGQGVLGRHRGWYHMNRITNDRPHLRFEVPEICGRGPAPLTRYQHAPHTMHAVAG